MLSASTIIFWFSNAITKSKFVFQIKALSNKVPLVLVQRNVISISHGPLSIGTNLLIAHGPGQSRFVNSIKDLSISLFRVYISTEVQRRVIPDHVREAFYFLILNLE